MQHYCKRMNVTQLFVGGLCLLIVLLGACKEDKTEIFPDRKPKEIALKFSVKLPTAISNSIETYALDGNDEAFIESVDILVFADDGNGNMKFNHRARGQIDNLPRIEAKLWKTETNSRLVVLANVRNQLNEYHFSNEETLEQMQSKLQYKLEGAWPAKLEDEEEFVSLPMWAELDLGSPIDDDIDLTDDDLNLLRSVARVDVLISATASNFALEAVYVFNSNRNGLIMPDPNNLTGSVATAPSLPIPLEINDDLDLPLIYETDGGNSEGEIYLFETSAASSLNLEAATGLVIKGSFPGEVTPGPYYYRIDFKNAPGNSFVPLLRNRWYRINIVSADFELTSVRYANEKDAFQSGPSLDPVASYFHRDGINPAQFKGTVNTDVLSTKHTSVSIKSPTGLQYTIATINENE